MKKSTLKLLSLLLVLLTTVSSYATTYYSKGSATDFANITSWGTAVNGTGSSPLSLTTADTFWVSNNAALTLGSTVAVGAVYLNSGSLSISANTLSVQPPTGYNAYFIGNTGTLSISGTGILAINGNLKMGGSTTLNQSGGDIIIDGNDGGAALTSVPAGTAIFELGTMNYSFTGGTITIVDPSAAATATPSFLFSASAAGTTYNTTKVTTAHTFRFGNGSSTDAGGTNAGFWVNTNGYSASTTPSYVTNHFFYGNLTIDAVNGSTNRRYRNYNATYGAGYNYINGDLNVNSGYYFGGYYETVGGSSYYSYYTYLAGNLTVAAGATYLSYYTYFTKISATGGQLPQTVTQTVSGAGQFQAANSGSSAGTYPANFYYMYIINSSSTGVVFDCTASPSPLLSAGNTGTVYSSLIFTTGIISVVGTSNPFILGVSTSTPGSFTATNGGFSPGMTVQRWFSTSTMPTISTSSGVTSGLTTNYFPFVTGYGLTTVPRYVFMGRSGTWTTGGYIQATYNDAATTSVASITDGTQTINQRTDASWTFATGGGLNLGATTVGVGFRADNLLLPKVSSPGNQLTQNPRVCYSAAPANGAHGAPGTNGTTLQPVAYRTGLTSAQLGAQNFYVGMNKDSSAIYSVANGNWETAATWSTNSVPTASQTPIIAAGTTVTTTAAGDTATSVSILGTLVINAGSTLGLAGTATTGNAALTVATIGTLTVNGGTLNVGPYQAGGNTYYYNTLLCPGTLNMQSGNLNIYGNLNFSAISAVFNQSGGTITIDPNNKSNSTYSASGSNYTLYIQTPNVTLSGGSIIITDPSFASYALYVNYSNIYPYRTSPIYASTSHTLQFGDGVSTDTTTSANGFYAYYGGAYVSYPNAVIYWGQLIINGGGGVSTSTYTNKRQVRNYYGIASTDMTINANSEYSLGYYNTLVRRNLVNNGMITQWYTTSTLGPPTYYYGNIEFAELGLSTPNNYTNATPYAGSLSGSGTFKQYYSNLTTDTLRGLVVNAPLGVTINIGRTLNVQNGVSIRGGYINNPAPNTIRATSPGLFGSFNGGYINGAVSKYWGAPRSVGNGYAMYPTGKNRFNPISFDPVLSGTNQVEIAAERFEGNSGTKDPASTLMANINGTAYWYAPVPTNSAALTSMDIKIQDSAMVSGTSMAYSSSASGLYNEIPSGTNFTTGTDFTNPNSLSTVSQGVSPYSIYKPYIGWGNMNPLQLVGVTATQQVLPSATVGSTAQTILRVNVAAAGFATASDSINFSSIGFTYTGTDRFDVAAGTVKLWLGTSTAPVTQLGSALSLPTGAGPWGPLNFSGFNVKCGNGTTYLWLTVDVDPAAVLGDNLDAKVIANSMNFTYSGAAQVGPATEPGANIDPAGSKLIDYCLGQYTGTTVDTLTNVTFNHVSQSVGLGSGSPYNYTLLTGPNGYIDSVERTASYPLSMTASYSTNGFAAWADWNQDGNFSGAGEFIDSSGGYYSSVSPGTPAAWKAVTIPSTASLGITRFRLRHYYIYSTPWLTQYCSNNTYYGITCDMNIRVIPSSNKSLDSLRATQTTFGVGPGTTNNPGMTLKGYMGGSNGTIVLNSLTVRCKGTNLTNDLDSVSLWNGTTLLAIGKPTAGVVTFSGLLDTFTSGLQTRLIKFNTTATAVLGDTIDFYMNAGDATYSYTAPAVNPGTQPSINLDPSQYLYIDYCKGTNVMGTASDTIQVLKFNNIQICPTCAQTSGLGGFGTGSPYYYTQLTGPNGYADSIVRLNTYTMDVGRVNSASNWDDQYMLWADWDQNGDFSGAGEFISASTSYCFYSTLNSSTSTANVVAPGWKSITVPANATLGITRMRVRHNYFTVSPVATAYCNAFTTYGSTLDIFIKILPAPDCSTVTLPSADTTTASNTGVCQSDSVTLGITVQMPPASNFTYAWQRSATYTGTYTTIATTITSTYKAYVNYATRGYYRCVILCNGTPVFTCDTVYINVSDPAVATTNSPQAVCGPDTATLIASSVDGGALTWFDKQKGGTLLSTGATYKRYVTAQDTVWVGAQSLTTSNINLGATTPSSLGGTVTYGYSTSYGQHFVATNSVTINTVDVYPQSTAGNIQIAIKDSVLGIDVYTSPIIPNSTIGSVVTIPLGVSLPPGTYFMHDASGNTQSMNYVYSIPTQVYPYLASGISMTYSTYANYYFHFFNWNVTVGCIGTRLPVVTNFTTPPVVTATANSSLICPGAPDTLHATSSDANYVYTWTPGNLVGANQIVTATSSPATYTVSAADPTGAHCKYVTSTTISWKNAPNVGTILASDNPVCQGVPDQLISVGATMNLPIYATSYFDFNSGLQGWTVGGTITPAGYSGLALFNWFATPSSAYGGYSVNGTGHIQASPDATGSTYTIHTTATSPVVTTVGTGYTNLSVSYQYYYTYYTGGGVDTTYLYGSTNGGTTWTVLKQYSASAGSNLNPVSDTIQLPASYNNNPNVQFQFYYRSNWGFYLGIDNFAVNAYNNLVSQKWTPIANLYNDSNATVSYASTAKDTVYFKAPSTVTGNYTVYATATAAGTGCTSRDSIVLTVTATCGVLWTGAISTDWHNSGNWDPNVIPSSCNFDVTIPASATKQPVISSASVQVGNLNINGVGVVVTLNSSKNLSICKDLHANISTTTPTIFTGTGNVIMNGTTRQTIYGHSLIDLLTINSGDTVATNATSGYANVEIEKGLTLQGGVLKSNPAGLVRLLSDSKDSVAWVDDFGTNTGKYSGKLLVERQVGTSSSSLMQHFMSSPVQTTFNDLYAAPYGWGSHQYLVPASNTAEDSILYTSPYSTAMSFVESNVNAVLPANVLKAWNTASYTDNWIPGKGYSVWLNSGAKYSLIGSPNTGNISVSGCTNSNWSFTSSLGHTYTSGYNLVGNPYPSSITMNTSRAAAGFDAAVVIYQPTGPFHGTYQSYTIGGGTPPTIPAFGGFLVRKSATGGSASFPFYQAERNTNEGPNYRFYKAASENHIALTVAGNGFQDVTHLEFNAGATSGFDADYDADKFHSNAGQPTIYTLMPNRAVWTAINVLGSLSQTATVPVGLEAGANGNFTITVDAADIASFDPTTYIYLEDKQSTGAWIDLRSTSSYSFTAKATDARDRFVLHFTPAMDVKTVDASCVKPGKIELTQPGTASWNYVVTDHSGNTVQSGTINSNTPASVNANTGNYTVTLVDANNYTVTKNILVNGSQSIIAAFNASKVTNAVHENVTFTSSTAGATSYEWNFGDGSNATGVAATHSYAATGKYTVTLKVTSSDGCQSITTQEVSVGSATGIIDPSVSHGVNIFSFENKVMVDFTKLKEVDADIAIYNLIGQQISNEHYNTNTTYVKAINDMEAAYIVVKVTLANGQIATKKLFITAK